jgi:hypothetical protein
MEGDSVIWTLLLTMFACNFGAATKVTETDSDVFDAGDEPSDDGGEDPTDTGEPPEDETHPSDLDDDRDGYTENQGDCDDDDADIAPDMNDICNGIDDNCDGIVDEDAADGDTYEPNDLVDYGLGALEEVFEITSFLDSEDDVDRFSFVYSDSWADVDDLIVTLSGFTGEITYKLEVVNVDTGEELFEDFNATGEEFIEFTLDGGWGSESGEYRVVVSSLGGAGCMNPYRLEIVHSDWWR